MTDTSPTACTNETLVARIQAGERELLADLWQQNRGLVHNVVSRYYKPCGSYDMDDLMQLGFIGLTAAADGYDATTNAPYISYLVLHVKTTVRRALGIDRQRDTPLVVSLDAPAGPEGEDTLLDTLADQQDLEAVDPQEHAASADEQRIVRKAVASLPAQQAEVLRRVYWGGETLTGVASAGNLTYQRVIQLQHGALQRLYWNKELRRLREDTPGRYYRSKGARAFHNTRSSTVEDIVLGKWWIQPETASA